MGLTTKNYKIVEKDLIKLLDKLQEFTTTFENFVLKHHKYSYETNIEQKDGLWECIIKIKNESDNFEVLERTSRAPGVL